MFKGAAKKATVADMCGPAVLRSTLASRSALGDFWHELMHTTTLSVVQLSLHAAASYVAMLHIAISCSDMQG